MSDRETSAKSLRSAEWLEEMALSRLFEALEGRARIVGGAVRDSLLGESFKEIDLATPLTPDEVMARLKKHKIRAIPTGIAHGTITAHIDGRDFEITTLRRDVKTDGRHAEITFTQDWREDAMRRDFTINALYASREGAVYDPLECGVADLEAGRVRFIGSAEARIQEDYLRVLRFFRFSARYAKGSPDEEGMKACFAHAEGLDILSAERKRDELLKLLTAPRAPEMIALMAAGGIWQRLMPEGEGIALHAALHERESGAFFPHDPIRAFASFFAKAESAAKAARRLKLSKDNVKRVQEAFDAKRQVKNYLSTREVRRLLYLWGRRCFSDRVYLAWAKDPNPSRVVQWRALLAIAESWRKPELPLTGQMVRQAGVPEGPEVGRILKEVEEWWIDADFTEDIFSITERLKAIAQARI